MKRTSVTHIAAKRLQEMIQSGELPPNEQLPSQLVLSQQLGISRASLREALSTLETLGFLRIEPGRGTFVTDSTRRESDQLASRALNGQYSKRDIYQTRLELESSVVVELAPVITEEALAALTEANEAMRDAWHQHDLVMVVTHDRVFHQTLWQLCPNELLRDLCLNMEEEFSATRSYPLPATRERRFIASTNEHTKIVENLANGNGEQAAAVMRLHIHNTAAAAGIFLRPLTRVEGV